MSKIVKDSEWRFIGALLNATPQEQDRFYTQQLPLGIFRIRQQEMLWIQRFREKHGQYPSRVAAQIQFKERIPVHDDPMEACLQPICDFSMFDDLRKINHKTKQILDEGKPVIDAVNFLKDEAAKLNDYSIEYVDSDFSKSPAALARYREFLRLKNNPKSTLIDFPWPALNKLVSHVRPGNAGVLAARTALGKTWLTVALAHYWALKGIKTLYITKEMPTEEIEDRFEALHFELPYTDFRSGSLSGKVLREWRNKRVRQKQFPLIICGDETLDGTGVEHVSSKIQEYKPRVAIVDGAYLLKGKGLAKNASRNEVLAFVSSRMKVIAKATKTVILSTVQINRTGEDKQGNAQGGIGSIYGTDTWSQDSDFVFILKGKRGSPNRILALEKSRESNIGEFTVRFQLDPYPQFTETKSIRPNTGKQVKFRGV